VLLSRQGLNEDDIKLHLFGGQSEAAPCSRWGSGKLQCGGNGAPFFLIVSVSTAHKNRNKPENIDSVELLILYAGVGVLIYFFGESDAVRYAFFALRVFDTGRVGVVVDIDDKGKDHSFVSERGHLFVRSEGNVSTEENVISIV
jgi:hypothetical protein